MTSPARPLRKPARVARVLYPESDDVGEHGTRIAELLRPRLVTEAEVERLRARFAKARGRAVPWAAFGA
jgi:hypothetical protein